MTKSDVVSLQRLFSVPITFYPNTKNKVDCIVYLVYSTLVNPFWHILKLYLNILFTIQVTQNSNNGYTVELCTRQHSPNLTLQNLSIYLIQYVQSRIQQSIENINWTQQQWKADKVIEMLVTVPSCHICFVLTLTCSTIFYVIINILQNENKTFQLALIIQLVVVELFNSYSFFNLCV